MFAVSLCLPRSQGMAVSLAGVVVVLLWAAARGSGAVAVGSRVFFVVGLRNSEEQSVIYVICLISRLWPGLPIPENLKMAAPRMLIPFSSAAFIFMVTGMRSARVRPRRTIISLPTRQLWQPVSAITEEVSDIVLARSLKPKSVKSSPLAERVRQMYDCGLEARLVRLSLMLLYRWWSRVMGRALFQW